MHHHDKEFTLYGLTLHHVDPMNFKNEYFSCILGIYKIYRSHGYFICISYVTVTYLNFLSIC